MHAEHQGTFLCCGVSPQPGHSAFNRLRASGCTPCDHVESRHLLRARPIALNVSRAHRFVPTLMDAPGATMNECAGVVHINRAADVVAALSKRAL